MANKNRGRPTKITASVLNKLEDFFLRGLSDREACLLADISPQTLYNYCYKHPEFLERKEILKQRVKIRAKLNISNAIEKGDIDISKWYLERRDEDFKAKQAVTHSANIGIRHNNPFDELTVEELRALISLEENKQ